MLSGLVHVNKAINLYLFQGLIFYMKQSCVMFSDLANCLMEGCVQPLSMITEQQVKPRRMVSLETSIFVRACAVQT